MQNICSVKIKWLDASSHGGPGWVDIEDAMEFAQSPPPLMETIGYVLHEQESTPESSGYIVLVDTLGLEECSTVHKIPHQMIVQRVSLDGVF